jgi:RNA-directed DNA polymerase
VAQTVAAMALEARTEAIFHRDSYGYRPWRGALDALAMCRRRCWEKDWVIDLDVARFFDSVPWDLMVKAVQANITTGQKWVLLYVRRWLAAPLQRPDGTLEERDRGTPQGSAVSPVLANLFMHYAFDIWLGREFPAVRFERFADDAVVHCATERQARQVLAALAERMEEVGLRLHPAKTRIVYCKDSRRRGSFEHTSFTFLGYTFGPRRATYPDGKAFTSFLPAVSAEALKVMGQRVRSWRSTCAPGTTLVSSPDGSTRSWRAGWHTMAGFTGRNCIPSCDASIPTWRAGRGRNTRGCAPTSVSAPGGPGFSVEIPACSGTGRGRGSSAGKGEKSRVTGDC